MNKHGFKGSEVVYAQGFMDKCAALGVDPDMLLKEAVIIPGGAKVMKLLQKGKQGLRHFKGNVTGARYDKALRNIYKGDMRTTAGILDEPDVTQLKDLMRSIVGHARPFDAVELARKGRDKARLLAGAGLGSAGAAGTYGAIKSND